MWQNICISTPDRSTFYYDPFRDVASSIPTVFINLDEALHLRRSNAAFLSVDNAAIEKERLDHVKRLLRTTARPIGRIAEETGFGSADCLSRLFRQRTGKSPRAWRAQHAQ